MFDPATSNIFTGIPFRSIILWSENLNQPVDNFSIKLRIASSVGRLCWCFTNKIFILQWFVTISPLFTLLYLPPVIVGQNNEHTHEVWLTQQNVKACVVKYVWWYFSVKVDKWFHSIFTWKYTECNVYLHLFQFTSPRWSTHSSVFQYRPLFSPRDHWLILNLHAFYVRRMIQSRSRR